MPNQLQRIKCATHPGKPLTNQRGGSIALAAHTATVSSSSSRKRNRSARTPLADVAACDVPLTHPDRVLYPRDGITKRTLAEYFEAVGEAAMPHLARRPLAILRLASGAKPFFQKHFLAESTAGLAVVDIANAERNPRFVVVRAPAGLVQLAQMGAVELHGWGAVMPNPQRADRLTFDLDPGAGLAFPRLREAALAVRSLLRERGLESWVKTTGGNGLHVVAPLGNPRPDWAVAKAFSRSISVTLTKQRPSLFTAKSGERNRQGKVFADYLRNAFGATAVAAFSPRWRPGVGVSTPIDWDELEADVRAAHFNLRNVPRRLARRRLDPWSGYWTHRQSLKWTSAAD